MGTSIWCPRFGDLELETWSEGESRLLVALACLVLSRLVSSRLLSRALVSVAAAISISLFFLQHNLLNVWAFFFCPFSSFLCSESRAFPVSISSNFFFFLNSRSLCREVVIRWSFCFLWKRSLPKWKECSREIAQELNKASATRSPLFPLCCFVVGFWGGCCYCFCCFNPRDHSFPFSGNSFLFVEIHERLLFDHFFLNNAVYIEYDYILWFSSVLLLHDLLRSSFCFFFVSHQVNDVFCSGSLSRFAKAWRKLATLEWIQEFVLCFLFSSSLATENDAWRVFLMLKVLRSSCVLFSCSED